MISLIPCYSLEDFSLYRKSSEVDEIFSAWSALYHPALVSYFGEAPRWEAAGSPSTGKKRRLIVVPPCTEYLISRTWLKSAEAEGAVVIRHISDRDEILKEAFRRLGISPIPCAEGYPTYQEKAPGEKLEQEDADAQSSASSESTSTPSSEQSTSVPINLPYDDATESFLAVGLCALMEELLTRKLRYMSNLDQISFNTRIVDAARAHMSLNVEEREKNLQKAFDLLATAKEYFFPTATKFLDLTWTYSEDLGEALPTELKTRRQRDAKTNLVLPVPVLKKCEQEYPKTFQLLKEEISAKRVSLVGGDLWEGPLYLMNPKEIGRMLLEGRAEYLRAFGTAPTVFGRIEPGYAQILPQLLLQAGYCGTLGRTGDGWSLLAKPSDRSQFLWTGRDGSSIATFCKRPLDATSSEEILQMPERIGNSYYSDNASAIVFDHRPNAESRWLNDLLRMDRYSPVLGKFYEIEDYFRVTSGSGDKEKFVKDNFKTNFLTRSSKRSRPNVVSNLVARQRLGQISSVLNGLETTIRESTLKTKPTSSTTGLFDAYASSSRALAERVESTLQALDAELFPVEQLSAPQDDNKFTAPLEQFEEEKNAVLAKASTYLRSALGPTKSDGQFRDSPGYLFINASSVPKELVWETRSLDETKTKPDVFSELFSQAPQLKARIFTRDSDSLTQYNATLLPGSYFWLPRLNGYEYHFLDRPLFDDGRLPERLLSSEPQISSEENGASQAETNSGNKKKKSFFQKFATKLRGDVPNLARQDGGMNAANENDERLMAEYVVKRYSATEIEKYYRLHNNYLDIRIDPTTGAVRRVTTFGTNARFHNGVLHQPGMGNRVAFDLAFKLSASELREDARSTTDSGYGYSISAADSIEILSTGPSIGRIQIKGRLTSPNGDPAGRFTQILTLRLKSRIIESDVELEPLLTPNGGPWETYFCCRFAWKDTLAELRGGVGGTLIGTARDYLQAPECVDIRSDANIGITILSGGLPYFRKVSDSRLDCILIPSGETKRNFRFAVGVDLADPHLSSLSYLSPDPVRLEEVPCPKRVSGSFLSCDAKNIQIIEQAPILSDEESKTGPLLRGVKLTILETHSATTEATIHSYLPIDRVEFVDLLGREKKETVESPNANSIVVKIAPRGFKTLNIYFRSSSLK